VTGEDNIARVDSKQYTNYSPVPFPAPTPMPCVYVQVVFISIFMLMRFDHENDYEYECEYEHYINNDTDMALTHIHRGEHGLDMVGPI
jgi:hypothetical protein